MGNRYIEAHTNPNAFKFDKERAAKLDVEFDTRTTINDGVVRWISNNNIPPNDILEFWNYLGKDFDYNKTIETSKEETKKFFEEYRQTIKLRNPSSEDLAEMKAAFGPGATVVNIITGEKIQL